MERARSACDDVFPHAHEQVPGGTQQDSPRGCRRPLSILLQLVMTRRKQEMRFMMVVSPAAATGRACSGAPCLITYQSGPIRMEARLREIRRERKGKAEAHAQQNCFTCAHTRALSISSKSLRSGWPAYTPPRSSTRQRGSTLEAGIAAGLSADAGGPGPGRRRPRGAGGRTRSTPGDATRRGAADWGCRGPGGSRPPGCRP